MKDKDKDGAKAALLLDRADSAGGIPIVHASTIEAGTHANELVIQFSSVASTVSIIDGQAQAAVGTKPAAAVVLSPQTAKDLLVVLGTVLAQYEAEWGEIDTPYLRGRRQGSI